MNAISESVTDQPSVLKLSNRRRRNRFTRRSMTLGLNVSVGRSTFLNRRDRRLLFGSVEAPVRTIAWSSRTGEKAGNEFVVFGEEESMTSLQDGVALQVGVVPERGSPLTIDFERFLHKLLT